MNQKIIVAGVLAALAFPVAANEFSNNATNTPTDYRTGPEVILGATSISQQSDNTPGTAGAACGVSAENTTSENAFYRRFYLAEHGAGPTATVSEVTIAIRSPSGNAALPITVNLYTLPASTPVDTIPLGALTQIGTATATVSIPAGNPPAGVPTAVTIPVSGTIADTTASNLVVEWTNGVGVVTSPMLFPANNTSAETHPSFIRAPGCNLFVPETFASIGFQSSVVMVLRGTGLPVSLQEFSID